MNESRLQISVLFIGTICDEGLQRMAKNFRGINCNDPTRNIVQEGRREKNSLGFISSLSALSSFQLVLK